MGTQDERDTTADLPAGPTLERSTQPNDPARADTPGSFRGRERAESDCTEPSMTQPRPTFPLVGAVSRAEGERFELSVGLPHSGFQDRYRSDTPA